MNKDISFQQSRIQEQNDKLAKLNSEMEDLEKFYMRAVFK